MTVPNNHFVEAYERALGTSDREQEAKLKASYRRFVAGNPTFGDLKRCTEYVLTGVEPKKIFKRYMAGMPVQQACRRAGLEPGPQYIPDPYYTVAQSLSFDDTERPSEEACNAVARLYAYICDRKVDAQDRLPDAAAYTLLGRNPESTRQQLHRSGKIRRAATSTICQPNTFPDNLLLKDWTQVADDLAAHPTGHELEKLTLADGQTFWWSFPTHQVVAETIAARCQQRPASRDSPTQLEVATSGQIRPKPPPNPARLIVPGCTPQQQQQLLIPPGWDANAGHDHPRRVA